MICGARRALILNRQKIVLAQASTAYKHSLKEVLASPAIASQIKVRRFRFRQESSVGWRVIARPSGKKH